MKFYKAIRNSIVDSDGKQVAVVVPVSCTKREAAMMASFAAQQMIHERRKKERAKRGEP